MDKITDACNSISEKVKETFSGTSKEAHKEVAKDSNQSIGTRAQATVDAASDKIDETTHAANKEISKQKATH